ncbi:MAG: transcriptional regulator [Bacteroidetes bacterium]|nr:transcriptional regulator [Bacteroidota bacterium]
MNTLHLPDNITTFYVKATSFPGGVQQAHKILHALVPYSKDRNYFGISQGEPQGKIYYMAAATELEPGDLEKNDLPKFVIQKGIYLYQDIDDFMQKIPLIGETFEQLLKHPQLDPAGYCLEWYLSQTTCRCLVKLNDNV